MTYGARPYGSRTYGDATAQALGSTSSSVSSGDTASGAEAVTLVVHITDADTAVGTEAVVLTVHLTGTETAAGTEAEHLSTVLVAVPDGVAYLYENVGFPSSLAVESNEAAYTYENTTTNVPTPHIWYLTKIAGFRGDLVTVVGMGFGVIEAQYFGAVYLEAEFLVPLSWFDVPANARAYDSFRHITPSTDTADPEHQRIQFTIPQDAQSGNVRVILNA